MKELENLKELYLEEIKKINKKGELSPADSEAARKSLEAIAKIDEICCNYDDAEYSERSYRMPQYAMRSYHMPNERGTMMPELMHDDYIHSDRRGRDSLGRYVSRSSGESVDKMIRELEVMHMNAPDEKTRMAIEHAIRKLEEY